MTYKITAIAAMLLCLFTLSSCLEEKEVTYYDDAAITSVTLGTVTCVKGKSTYNYSASGFVIHIDQINDSIYNTDSLVVGTVMKSVPMTITTKNYASVLIKNLDNEYYSVYSSSEPVNLDTVRTFRVLSTDGLHYREYKVNINAHKEDANAFTWSKPDTVEVFKNLRNIKAVAVKGALFLLGNDGTKDVLYTYTANKEWKEFTEVATGDAPAALGENTTIAVSDSISPADTRTMYLHTGNVLYSTEDGITWTNRGATTDMKAILGSCGNAIYGVNVRDSIIVSYDDANSLEWKIDDMMNSNAYGIVGDSLPHSDYNFIVAPLKTNERTAIASIVANKKKCMHDIPGYENINDTTCVTWNKVIDGDEKTSWILNTAQWNNYSYVMPRMEHLSVAYYAGQIIAFGGNCPKKIYYSPDQGTTWHTHSGMKMPEEFNATDGATMVADGEGRIYLIATGTGQVFCGRQNKQTWKKKQTYFE